MSDPDEHRASEHHRTRSMFVVLGVLGLLTVVTPQLTAATTSPPTTPTSTRAVVPARPSPGCAHPRGSQGPGTSDVPVVLCTAASQGRLAELRGSVPIVMKPFTIGEIERVLDAALQRRRHLSSGASG